MIEIVYIIFKPLKIYIIIITIIIVSLTQSDNCQINDYEFGNIIK